MTETSSLDFTEHLLLEKYEGETLVGVVEVLNGTLIREIVDVVELQQYLKEKNNGTN